MSPPLWTARFAAETFERLRTRVSADRVRIFSVRPLVPVEKLPERLAIGQARIGEFQFDECGLDDEAEP